MLEEIPPLSPAHFFAIQADCHAYSGRREQALSRSHLLPDLAQMYGETSFAKVAIGWSRKGLTATFLIDRPVVEVHFPNYREGDSVELFIDTRDVKTSGYPTRFCHHFFFLPDPVQTNGDTIHAGEVTRFRGEDVHELCSPDSLFVQSAQKRKSYTLQLFIPAESLHGYDPTQFQRLGFAYRINRWNALPQSFSVASSDVQIEKQPSLWATLNLVE